MCLYGTDNRRSMTKEIKQQTQKIYVNLPEVVQKKQDEKKSKDREVNRTMKDIYSAVCQNYQILFAID